MERLNESPAAISLLTVRVSTCAPDSVFGVTFAELMVAHTLENQATKGIHAIAEVMTKAHEAVSYDEFTFARLSI